MIKMRIDAWKISTIFLISIILIAAIIFAIPIKEVPYETMETYYETEIKRIPHVKEEPYSTQELHENSIVVFDGFRYVVPSGIDIPFHIAKPDARVLVTFEASAPGGFRIYSSSGRIVYEKLGSRGTFDIPLPEGNYKAQFRENVMWGYEVYVNINMILIIKAGLVP